MGFDTDRPTTIERRWHEVLMPNDDVRARDKASVESTQSAQNVIRLSQTWGKPQAGVQERREISEVQRGSLNMMLSDRISNNMPTLNVLES